MQFTTKDVLERNYPSECEDKLYLVCEIFTTEQGWDVHLFRQDPVLWLNAKYKENFGCPADFVVSELSKDSSNYKSLLSAGALLYYEGKLVLLKRDAGAPSYAGFLNEPCGRCGELPQTTVFKELSEELGVTLKGSAAYFQADTDINQVSKQCHQNSIKLIPVRLKLNNQKLGLPLNIVNIYLDFQLVQSIEGVSYFDRKNNVLEVHQVFEVEPGQKCTFFDNENYGREIHLMTEVGAAKEKCVPYLEHILGLIS